MAPETPSIASNGSDAKERGDPVKIKPKSQEIGDVFAWM
jgi:hypothetical protein